MGRVYFSIMILCLSAVSLTAQRTLSVNETWTGNHIESNDVIVPDGITLTISPGTTVRFAAGKSLKITGTGVLHAGNSDASGSSILFTADDGNSWGHIYCENSGTSWIKNCEIEKGSTSGLTEDYGSIYGGAIHIKTSSLTVEKCFMHNNNATWGGGIFVNANCNPVIAKSRIYSNTATEGGGGLYIWQGSRCVTSNCIIYNNNCTGTTLGGGGLFMGYSTSYAKIENCLIIGNSSTNVGPGIYFLSSPNSKIINSVVWGNGSGTQVYFDSTPTNVMVYCGVQGDSYSTCLNLNAINSASDGPNFIDPSAQNYNIIYYSVLRDAGTTTDAPASDFLDNLRIGAVDIGAFEFQYSRWTGSTSTNWATATNWDKSLLPATNSYVVVPDVTNDPVLSSSDATINELITETGGSLSVSGNILLTATLVTNRGSIILLPGSRATITTLSNLGTVRLESDASSVSSLITGSFSGNPATIELNLTGGEAGSKNYRWHYISSPVSSISVSVFTPATQNIVRYYDSRVTTDLTQGWVAYDGYIYTSPPSMGGPTFSQLLPGIGYDYYDQTDNEFTFQGQVNTSDVAVPLSYAGVTPTLSGFNLLGNPFPSGLDWDYIVTHRFPSNTSKGVYFTRNNSVCSYMNGIGVPGDVTGFIPPMQGFFTKAYATGKTIYLADSARTHSLHSRYKGSGIIPMVRLLLAEETLSDETVVRFDEKAAAELDFDFDALKFFYSEDITSIYTTAGANKLVINGLPFPESTVDVPVGINIKIDGNHSISGTQLQGLDFYNVSLIDNVTGFTTNLKTNPVLNFSSSAGSFSDRFILRVSNSSTGVEEHWTDREKTAFNIYQGSGFINIQAIDNNWEGKTGSVTVYDLTGKKVREMNETEFSMISPVRIPVPGTRSLYLVEIKSGPDRYTGKVIIR